MAGQLKNTVIEHLQKIVKDLGAAMTSIDADARDFEFISEMQATIVGFMREKDAAPMMGDGMGGGMGGGMGPEMGGPDMGMGPAPGMGGDPALGGDLPPELMDALGMGGGGPMPGGPMPGPMPGGPGGPGGGVDAIPNLDELNRIGP